MSLFRVFDVAGSAMSAQSVRLNTTASNLANANSVSSSAGETYKARYPIFQAQFDQANAAQNEAVGVNVAGIVESDAPLVNEFNPNHPLADENGYVYRPNVNVMEEMANMISASRSYQTNVQIADSAKQMLNKTLTLGQG
ncbi:MULTISPECIES: flagellar basal body rod protein FlgC [Moritella]|uniref:Flagellar basal-body rod protein FlgC n=1 Tax=Moritella viscosa TaxID=80854 RepID=A0A090IGK2_9GAMM|nr:MULTISPECIES: flagellar basal body rod protein FlgC [Moritella]QUM79638.1 flagellar basal body rod protein FlgC [Moritella sp. 5]QUM83861.1 flagellar basal body rod protein FlgC [Moritella sp. 28]CED61366.1 flagellar basal-body rod protein FlgC [Moritella viscosa]SGY88696.1 Flagellar biosynthesis; cell-proximal portion of basal-body rod [Moritella viscosa]SGY92196.1 Flagellar biosynthesis; cell-proximal portion of basal-body rod [Moritella viscosa]